MRLLQQATNEVNDKRSSYEMVKVEAASVECVLTDVKRTFEAVDTEANAVFAEVTRQKTITQTADKEIAFYESKLNDLERQLLRVKTEGTGNETAVILQQKQSRYAAVMNELAEQVEKGGDLTTLQAEMSELSKEIGQLNQAMMGNQAQAEITKLTATKEHISSSIAAAAKTKEAAVQALAELSPKYAALNDERHNVRHELTIKESAFQKVSERLLEARENLVEAIEFMESIVELDLEVAPTFYDEFEEIVPSYTEFAFAIGAVTVKPKPLAFNSEIVKEEPKFSLFGELANSSAVQVKRVGKTIKEYMPVVAFKGMEVALDF